MEGGGSESMTTIFLHINEIDESLDQREREAKLDVRRKGFTPKEQQRNFCSDIHPARQFFSLIPFLRMRRIEESLSLAYLITKVLIFTGCIQ